MPLLFFVEWDRHTCNGVGAVGQRASKLPARHASCSARSSGRLTARRAPGSRGAAATEERLRNRAGGANAS